MTSSPSLGSVHHWAIYCSINNAFSLCKLSAAADNFPFFLYIRMMISSWRFASPVSFAFYHQAFAAQIFFGTGPSHGALTPITLQLIYFVFIFDFPEGSLYLFTTDDSKKFWAEAENKLIVPHSGTFLWYYHRSIQISTKWYVMLTTFALMRQEVVFFSRRLPHKKRFIQIQSLIFSYLEENKIYLRRSSSNSFCTISVSPLVISKITNPMMK